MTARRELVRRGERVGLPTGRPSRIVSRSCSTRLERVCRFGPAPPTLKEFSERHGVTAKDFEPLVAGGARRGARGSAHAGNGDRCECH